jgi:replicative DNA helicase
MSGAFSKPPPANIDAERATLGALLLNREAIVAVAPWLRAEYFYLEKHDWIYRAMLSCYAARIPPDIRTVSEELRRRGRLEAVGGVVFLAELTDAVVTSYHVAYYGRIVERTALLRRLICIGGQIAALGFDEPEDADSAYAAAMQLLLGVRGHQTADLVPISEVVSSEFDAFHRGALGAAPTGLRDLDELTGGLQRQDLIILAARPSVGKTGLALTIADHVADQGKTVAIFSLEMSREQCVQRLAAMRAPEDLHRVRLRQLKDAALDRYVGALGQVGDLPIWIDETPARTPMEIRLLVQRFRAEHGDVGLIVIDYLQLMAAPRRDGNRVQEVSEISRSLKALAKETNCPVLALSQLSRAVEQRQSHVPLLSDLRESGGLEQDADIVVFIYREELYDRETDKKGIAELIVAKHRNGPVGVVAVRFEPSTTRFLDLTRRSPDGYRGAS